MDFQEFWSKLQVELTSRKEFRSLARGTTFIAYFESNKHGELQLRVIPSSGQERGRIPRYEFNSVWDNAKPWPIENRFKNIGGRLNRIQKKSGGIGKSKQLTYIVKLIEHIVGDQDME